MSLATRSAFRGWWALVLLTLRRHWRVRALGWATAALVLLMSVGVAIFSHGAVGWAFAKKPARVADINSEGAVRMSYEEYATQRLAVYQALPGPMPQFAIKSLAFAPMRAMVVDPKFGADFAFLNYSRWIVFGMFLGFVLPLFTLAYASGAIGGEREGRTLIWLVTRPLPREAIYLGKLLGVLPWCIAIAMFAFALLCLAGGEVGVRALRVYWPAVLLGAVGFSALFHLIGAIFRRPAVVGLVYIFFFETLVANLPGSLKRLSLNYYVRSMMYNQASDAATLSTPESLEVYDPISATTAAIVLLVASAVFTLVGMVWFARQEPREEV